MDRPCILVVEDHVPLLMAVRGVLEIEGYDVVTATDGEKGLQAMEKTSPDLILTDIMMPNMDGYAMCEQVRARPEWVNIPIIFLTAKAEREDVLKAKAMGAAAYLTKPLNPDELAGAVKSRLV